MPTWLLHFIILAGLYVLCSTVSHSSCVAEPEQVAGPYMLCCSAITSFFVVQGQGRLRRAAGGVSENSAVTPEQAGELATDERTRQQQLQKALQLVMRLEDALSSFSMNVVSAHGVLVRFSRASSTAPSMWSRLHSLLSASCRLLRNQSSNLSSSSCRRRCICRCHLHQSSSWLSLRLNCILSPS